MRITRTTTGRPTARLDSYSYGDSFMYDTHLYMLIRTQCSGFEAYYDKANMRRALNLKSGTMRLLPRNTIVERVNAHIVLED